VRSLLGLASTSKTDFLPSSTSLISTSVAKNFSSVKKLKSLPAAFAGASTFSFP